MSIFSIRQQTYAKAFDCANCPGNSSLQGCPAWWTWEEHDEAGNVRIVQQCGMQGMLHFFNLFTHKHNITTENVVETKNQVAQILPKMANALQFIAGQIFIGTQSHAAGTQQLEHESEQCQSDTRCAE